MTEPIDGFEGSEPRAGASDRAFARTLGVVRRRRIARRAAAVLIVAAAYAAGVATPALVDRPREHATRPAPLVEAPSARPVAPTDLESRAATSPSREERAILLKAAGDRYLADSGDVQAALRCYRELLKLTPDADRARFDTTDSWLLAALKRDSD